ncbi:MAG: hypothetical protein ACRDHD_04940, partial [Candidatus Limnocylindria bacterium]
MVVIVLATLALLAAGPVPARAAEDGLVVVVDTTYRVLPAEGRVRVTLDAVATSLAPNTPQGAVYFSGITFAVPPEAQAVAASSEGAPLATRVVESTEDYAAIEVTFARGVFFRQSYAYTVEFDLVDPGGAGGRDLRIGRSVVAFPVWAFGTAEEPGGRVRVELPQGYSPTVQGGPMQRQAAPGGGWVLSAEPGNPLAFFAYVSADRPGAFTNTTLELTLAAKPAPILIRAWEDDPQWAARIGEVLSDGLPALQELIGIPYPVRGRLSVEEAAVSRLGEYAGIYNQVTGVIRVRYDADAFVTLHEAAHVWFNGRLFRDRWINEAWAEFYAVTAGEQVGASGAVYELTDDLLEARIPLNDWGAVGVEDLAVEDFAYAATYELAREVAGRTDLHALREVWLAADAGHMPYQPLRPDGEPQVGVPFNQPDWQRLLDLLEERTGQAYDDLWAEWVANPDQLPLLDERAEARALLDEVLEAAAGWELPRVIRQDLGAWEFGPALDGLALAEDVLADRDRIALLAAGLELEPPDTLRDAFEARDALEDAASEATAQLDTLAVLGDAAGVVRDEPGGLEWIGLLGSDPDGLLEAGREAFEDGDMEAAAEAART